MRATRKKQETSTRREPVQARSRQRVDEILDTTAALFAEIGYEAVTTNAVAERAGISIGSLYRYFPDKQALLRALAARHLGELRALYTRVLHDDAGFLPIPVFVDRLLDPFVEMHTRCPAYAHLVLGAEASADIGAVMAEAEEEMIDHLAGVLRKLLPGLGAARSRAVAAVCKASVKAMLSSSFRHPRPAYHAQVVAEMKQMLRVYLESLRA